MKEERTEGKRREPQSWSFVPGRQSLGLGTARSRKRSLPTPHSPPLTPHGKDAQISSMKWLSLRGARSECRRTSETIRGKCRTVSNTHAAPASRKSHSCCASVAHESAIARACGQSRRSCTSRCATSATFVCVTSNASKLVGLPASSSQHCDRVRVWRIRIAAGPSAKRIATAHRLVFSQTISRGAERSDWRVCCDMFRWSHSLSLGGRGSCRAVKRQSVLHFNRGSAGASPSQLSARETA